MTTNAHSFKVDTCPIGKVGDTLSSLDTPCLVVNRQAFSRNVDKMSCLVKSLDTERSIWLRPHAKTHKCPQIAHLLMKDNSVRGICCQKLDEVQAMVADRSLGINDILITNEIVGRRKIERLCGIMRCNPDFKFAVLVDNFTNLKMINTILNESPVDITLGIYIEINGGQNRGGLNSSDVEPIKSIGAFASDSSNDRLTFEGIHCYGGWLQHVRETSERDKLIKKEVVDEARSAVDTLKSIGVQCGVVTGAGTGSFRSEIAGGVHNELQPGSYIFMDADYAKNEEGAREFENSLFIHTTVCSTAVSKSRAVLDAGLKASSFDCGPPVLTDREVHFGLDGSALCPDCVVTTGGDEHNIVTGEGVERLKLKVGDTVRMIPGHIDPTVNMHEWLMVLDVENEGDEPVVVDVWPIAGRGPGL